MKPQLEPIPSAKFKIDGEIGRRLTAVTEQWILPAPFANPGMLEMFRNRDRLPYQQQMPWAGEFAGKYLTHAVQIYRLTRTKDLHAHIAGSSANSSRCRTRTATSDRGRRNGASSGAPRPVPIHGMRGGTITR